MEIHLNKRKKGVKESGRTTHSLIAAVAPRERALYVSGSSSSKKPNPKKSGIVRNAALAATYKRLVPKCTQSEGGG